MFTYISSFNYALRKNASYVISNERGRLSKVIRFYLIP